jgi:hypothetical protein
MEPRAANSFPYRTTKFRSQYCCTARGPSVAASGGEPTRGPNKIDAKATVSTRLFDNLKPAVDAIFTGKERR